MFQFSVLLVQLLDLFPDGLGKIDARIEIERAVPACAVTLDEMGLSVLVREDSTARNESDIRHVLIAHLWHLL
jgi:hypothetical protein